MELLSVHDMVLQYGTSRGPVRAVDGVSFEMAEPGEALGIIGETGSGKSSLVMGLTRILPKNVSKLQGIVRLNGNEISALSDERFRKDVRWKQIAVVFQGAMNAFNPVTRIGRQLVERTLVDRLETKERARLKMRELLASVGLPPETYDRYPHELSGGMRQRAAVAMALSMEPALLLMDEPTSALDVSVQAQIMNLFKKLKWERGVSMVFVTHDIALASDVCDRVAVMYGGRIREIGSVDDVLREPSDPYTQELLASIPRLHGGERPTFVTGTPPDPINPPQGCRFADRCPHVFDRCRSESPPLLPAAGRESSTHTARCWLNDRGGRQ